MQGYPKWGICMNKRYQVFVSSTFADLQGERRQVIETLLNLDCIPAGMEWFGAIDEEQFEYIKRVIDDCDYYVVIIGNRYGTLTAEGVSYTEKEYEYALSKKLKVVALLHKSPGDLPAKHADEDPEARKKLAAFRVKLESRRLVEYWEGAEQLAGKVATSMSKMIRMHPAEGWVRANQVASAENLAEVNELRKENERLKVALEEVASSPEPLVENIAAVDEKTVLTGKYHDGQDIVPWNVVVTWGEITAALGPYAMVPRPEAEIQTALANELFEKAGHHGRYVSLNTPDFQTVKVQLLALKLIKLESFPKVGVTWALTPSGEKVLLAGRVVKSSEAPKKTRRASKG
jgi:hypothetical protein